MKEIVFSFHALDRMGRRGASEEEVVQAIREGQSETARRGRRLYRLSFMYNEAWAGEHYTIKQVAPVVAEEADRIVVVTVYTCFF